MPRIVSPPITALVLAGAALLAAGSTPSLAAPRAPGAEFDVDLMNASGARVASIVGSVSATGTGFATTVPLSGASRVGMVRGENFRVKRASDGTISARGGLGSRLTISVNAAGRTARATGTLAPSRRGRRTVTVTGTGVTSSSPFRPARREQIITVGTTGGPIRAALGRRYRLVRYQPRLYSRAALLANPSRYARVAGVVVGPNVTAQKLISMDLVRSFHNSGRFVAASGNPAALDRALSTVHFAHLGRRPVIVRRATIALGASGHLRTQIRGPIYADVRAGQARRTRDDRLNAATLAAFNRASTANLNQRLGTAEALTDGPRRRGHETQTSSGSAAPTITASQNGLSYYSVQIQQPIYASISVPGALSFAQCGSSPAPTGSNQWAFTSGNCANAVQTQAVEINLTPLYTVSLVQSNGAVASQSVTETNYVQVDALANGSMAAGSYSTSTELVSPPAAYGPIATSENGFGWGWGQVYSSAQEAGLVFAQGVHQILATCPGCTSTSGGNSATVSYSEANSSPTQSITQVSGGTSVGSNWGSSQSVTNGWSVSANLGAFGSDPMGGVSGGYSSSTTNTTSTGGDIQTSTNFTLTDWNTSPFQTTVSSGGQQVPLVQYQTYSNQIPGASGSQAPAAQSLAYPVNASGNSSGLISTPANYGGQNGPGPSCSSLQGCAWTPSAAGLSSWPQGFGWGSGMNATEYATGSNTFLSVFGQGGTGQLAVGSVTPYAVDNLLFADQAIGSANSSAPVGISTAWTQLQILNQQSIQIATTAGGATDSPTYGGTGIGSGITTYYNSTGQVESNAQAGGYTTTGLDLCAPPVLTQQLWTAGCSTSTSLQSDNPPASYSGAPPTITAPGSSTGNGQLQVPPGATLTCNPGTWSGSPTGYAYQWQQWNSTFNTWQQISGATGATYTAPTTSGAYIECGATATNQWGSATAYSPSALVLSSTTG